MTLELNQISSQVKAMGKDVATQYKLKVDLKAEAKNLLQTYSTAFGELEARVARAEEVQESLRFNWVGAAPAKEALAQYYSAPSAPAKMTVIASDGSQIYPDQHGIALYYVINTGAIVYERGSGSKPLPYTSSEIFYKEDDIFDQYGSIIPNSLVNVKRDLSEVDILAKLSVAYKQSDIPLITLIDGQLSLRVTDLYTPEQNVYQMDYIESLNQLQKNNAIVGAYIDRPRGSYVISLMHLASLTLKLINEESLRHNPFSTLTDTELFEDLPPGQRTAIFRQHVKANEVYSKKGHPIYFFYLNVGRPRQNALARVEIPGWVAKNPEKLNILHAALVQQAAIIGSYPYVLSRADELAVISPKEREALDTKIAIEMRQNGLTPNLSQKQLNKHTFRAKD